MDTNRILQLLQPGWGHTVIDIGSGTSPHAWHVSDAVGPHGSVILFDIDRERAAEPLVRATDIHGHMIPLWGDVSRPNGTSLVNGRVDRALVSRVLSSIPDIESAIREIARITSGGGRVVIIEDAVPVGRSSIVHRPEEVRAHALRSGFSIQSFEEDGPVWILVLQKD
jgi:ubiquinone/menaquinone biosynthesis C-methylase UbiE